MQYSVLVIKTFRVNQLISRENQSLYDDADDQNLYDWPDNLHNQSGPGDINAVL